jgi:2,3,4,5-tetrahydropyridine-2,6-dicarboxylate N-succinyltransferase
MTAERPRRIRKSTESVDDLRKKIEIEFRSEKSSSSVETRRLFAQFIDLLDDGIIRAAECVNGEWRVYEWVKQGILLGFRLGKLRRIEETRPFSFFDKHTYPLKQISIADGVRIVPGGTSLRKGAHVEPGVIIMPPAYLNVGSFVGKGSMIDSHALVGSCAQIGERVHVSAAAQIGGVLEPIGALPVIVEDDVMIGGNSGIYEGTIVRQRSVIGAGVLLTGSTPVYDCVNECIIRKNENGSLIIPENAVVVAGSRPVNSNYGRKNGLGVYTPLIVKYRDARTDGRTALEESLRL